MNLAKRIASWAPAELKRTCSRCGTEWYITASERKLKTPNRMQLAGLKMQQSGGKLTLIGGKKKALIAGQQVDRLLAQAERVEQLGRCSKCGSSAFTEEAA